MPGSVLFKPREQIESGAGGPAAIAAALSHVQRLPDETLVSPADLRARLARLAARLRNLEQHVVHDLAEDIGSVRWYRGLAAMVGLGIAALAFWPDFSALDAAPAMRVDRATRNEFRSQMILPLGSGGESGRRMGANTALVVPLSSAPERASVHMVATLAQGDSFQRMLQRAGVGAYDAARSAELVGAVLPLGEIKPGTRFDITLGKREAAGLPRSLDKLDFQARFDTALTVSRSDGGLALGRHPIAVDATPLRIRGTVGPSLYRSARAAGAPADAVQQFLQAVDQQVSLEEISPTDAFDLVIAYKRSAGGASESGKLLFAGLEREGKPRVQLVRDASGQLQDALGGAPRQDWTSSVVIGGNGPGGGGLLAPVNGHVTSGYGLRRHPILGYTRMHSGIDFGAAWGSPIFAVAGGVVTYAGRHGGHGNYVRLEHGGFGTGYGHMSRIAVAPGTKVAAGQVIGYVGSSGLSTGPHLHYEVYQGGRTVNPAGFSFSGKVQVVVKPGDTKALTTLKSLLAKFKTVKPGAALGKFNPKAAAAED
jgi:murein DD-endopeptidase MepM/ murein hydrolase activator NlpD